MWTRIKLNFTGRDSEELSEMIFRSGSALLDVFIDRYYCDSFDPPQFADLRNILPHVHRFRNLQIYLPETLMHTVFRFLRQPAPRLRKLFVQIRELSGEQELNDSTLQEGYQNLFLGSAPKLTHVHLHISAGLRELQSVSLLKNLTKLHLYFVTSTIVDGDTLLAIFRSSPCLEVLRMLWAILGSQIVCDIPSNRRITMPRLRKLSLDGRCGIDNLDFILGCLNFVDKVDFDITCHDGYPQIANSELLLHFLATQRRLSLLSVASYFFSLTDVAIEFSEKMVMGFPAFHPRPRDSSVFRILYNDYAPLDTLSDSLRKFKMFYITHMYLEYVWPETTGLGSILPLLNNLELLHVNHVSWDEDYRGPFSTAIYLDILTPRVQKSNFQVEAAPNSKLNGEADPKLNVEATRAQFPCPSLQILELAFAGTFEESYIHELIRCSEIRGQTGHPFKSVIIYSRCTIFVEIARKWSRTYELERFPVEVKLWKI